MQIRICSIVHCKAFFRWSQECAARKVFKAFLCSTLGSSSKTHSFRGCSFHITIVITGFRGVVSPLTRTGCDWGGGGVERVCVGVCGDVGVGGGWVERCVRIQADERERLQLPLHRLYYRPLTTSIEVNRCWYNLAKKKSSLALNSFLELECVHRHQIVTKSSLILRIIFSG